METLNVIAKIGITAIYGSILYVIVYALLKGYIMYLEDLNVETVTKQFKIKCALAVPFVVGAFVLAVWIIRSFIKSGVYGENASGALTIIAVIVALFGVLIIHTCLITSKRFWKDAQTKREIEDLQYKIKKLEESRE
jgi:hypothetical protein